MGVPDGAPRRSLYHAILKTPDAEETARREANLCGILFMEDRDRKLAAIWNEVVAKVKAELAKKECFRQHFAGTDGSHGSDNRARAASIAASCRSSLSRSPSHAASCRIRSTATRRRAFFSSTRQQSATVRSSGSLPG